MSIINDILQNTALWAAITAWAIAQILKVIVIFLTTRKFEYKSSGGMPSSHSAFVTSLCVYMGKTLGFDSYQFAMAAVLCLVVVYDAAGVRRAAGRQASVLNIFLSMFENDDNAPRLDKKLKESLGHSPFEVLAGIAVGIIVGAVF